MDSPSHQFWAIAFRFLALSLASCCALSQRAFAQQDVGQFPTESAHERLAPLPAAASPTSTPLEVTVGIGGVWKIGHVCPVGVVVPEAMRASVDAVEVATFDGDGVALAYHQQVEPSQGQDGHVWVPIRIGGHGVTVTVRLLSAGVVVSESILDPYLVSQGYPSTQPLIVAIGSAMGMDELARNSIDGKETSFASVVLDAAEQLPTSYRDYSACDLLVISSSNLELLQAMSETQWTAIDTWIRGGGGCVISLAGSSDKLQAIDSFADLLPGRLVAEGRITNPAGLESFVVTDEPLQPFPVTLLELDDRESRVELTLSDSLARRLPWWVTYSHGHGTVRLVASDLDGEALGTWNDRKSLWQKLLAPYMAKEILASNGSDAAGGVAGYLGYDDLVGQLRATLDVFASVRVVTFGQVAGILVAILLLVGPLDYFISVKWLRRPEWSWIIAGTMLVAISIGLVALFQAIRPDEVLVNVAQIVDVDVRSGQVQGRLWSNVYSGSARRLNIHADGPSGNPVFLDWQGLPGRGLGGLQSQLYTDRGMPDYAIEISADGASAFRGVGIPSAGTKSLNGRWMEQISGTDKVTLQEMRGVDQLEGELVNPLAVDLIEPVLFYHKWYYVLNSRITPGERLAVSSETIPKTLTRRLNRQRVVDGNVSITRWDPADRNQLDRLLELMMFYKAASGSNYTSLVNRYQPHVDHSNLLETDVAILIGRVDASQVKVVVTQYDQSTDQPELLAESGKGINQVWYRITLPVARPNKP
jgi:hypothetical protein